METAVVIWDADGKLNRTRPDHTDPAQFAFAKRSGRLFLAKVIHELDQLDRAVPVLGRGRMEALLLAVGQTVERSLVLDRRFGEGLGNRRLQIGRKVRI